MKKKIYAMIALIILIPVLTACTEVITNTTTKTEMQTTQRGPSIPSAYDPPPQPIDFETISDAIAFIEAPDYSAYYEEWHSTYQKMVQRFAVDGYLSTVSHSVAEKLNDNVTLYPEATSEDVGIAFWFKYEDILYQVLIYSTKNGEEYTFDPETESILDYYEQRFDITIKYDYEHVDTNNLQMPQMVFYKTGKNDPRNAAKCMIDDTHYIVIKTKADKTALLSFIDGLQIDSLLLN